MQSKIVLMVASFVLALTSATAFGRDKAVNVAATLAHALENTVSAHVVLIRDSVLTPIAITEEYMDKHGCHFEVKDPSALADLLELIRQADITESETGSVPRFDVRSIVELTDEQGRKIRLVFTGFHDRTPGLLDGKPATADPRYHAGLQQWAAEQKPKGGLYSPCL